MRSTSGISRIRPGPLVAIRRPRRKMTPRSYSRRTLTERADRDQREEERGRRSLRARLPSACSFLGLPARPALRPHHQRQPVDRLDRDSIPRPHRRRAVASRARQSAPSIQTWPSGSSVRAGLGAGADQLLAAAPHRLLAMGRDHFAGDEVEADAGEDPERDQGRADPSAALVVGVEGDDAAGDQPGRAERRQDAAGREQQLRRAAGRSRRGR